MVTWKRYRVWCFMYFPHIWSRSWETCPSSSIYFLCEMLQPAPCIQMTMNKRCWTFPHNQRSHTTNVELIQPSIPPAITQPHAGKNKLTGVKTYPPQTTKCRRTRAVNSLFRKYSANHDKFIEIPSPDQSMWDGNRGSIKMVQKG